MSRAAIGTLRWAEGSRGCLSPSERRALVARALPMQLRDWWQALRRGLGLSHRAGPKFSGEVLAPDTPMAQRAHDTCAAVSSQALYAHCCRSYLWGTLLADLDGVRYDAELFYVAALLHDLGLTSVAPSSATEPCFAISGARAARRIVGEAGWPGERADEVADIIGQHLNVVVAAPASPEAVLLRAATAFDVIGQRAFDVSPHDVALVLRQHPRAGFKKTFTQLMADEAQRHPETRAALLVGRLQLLGRIRRAPFDE